MKDLGLKGQRTRGLLIDRLYKMVRAGQIIENRRNEFCLTAKLDLITGTVSGHRDGFGFVIREDGGGDDIYLSAREMRSVFDGDRVAIKIIGKDRRGKPAGELVEVLKRGVREVAGQFIRERGIGLVIPDNARISHRILIAKGEAKGAKPGQMVVAEILDYPSQIEQATGKIVRIIGDPNQKGIATDIAIESHSIPTQWPKAVKEEIKQFGKTVPDNAKKGRVDLRDTDLLTIDGADARDFDDAVFCEKSGDGWRLLVAIADVAHYVQNPKVDRLCMVCEMRIGKDGKVKSSKFLEGLMRSSARLTYSQVGEFLEGKSKTTVPKPLHGMVRELHALYKAFAKARQRRGAIELDLPQTRFELGENGEIVGIKAVDRNDAHKLIEECMIAANVEAARFLRKNKIPGLYRVHPKPDVERFDELRLYLVSLGLKVPHPEHVDSRQFNDLLKQVKDRPDSAAISMSMLRSLTHAEYTPENIGHFGLGLDAYAHFTSPIRRYPDLLVHRAIRHILRGGKPGRYDYSAGDMDRLGTITSSHERRAEDATRDVEAWLKCEYMESRVGQEFPGVVTGVTNFGLFVQIAELQIDGLVHVTSLANDYYHFESGSQRLVGERTGKAYSLGDAMQVRVHRVDLDTRKIDFRPVDSESSRKKSPKKSKNKYKDVATGKSKGKGKR